MLFRTYDGRSVLSIHPFSFIGILISIRIKYNPHTHTHTYTHKENVTLARTKHTGTYETYPHKNDTSKYQTDLQTSQN